MRPILVAVVAAVLASPSAAAVFQDLYTFTGSVDGQLTAKVKGAPKQKVPVSGPPNLLYFAPNMLRWNFNGGAAVLSGPMKEKKAKKKLVFAMTKPVDSDLTTLESEVESLSAQYASTAVTLTKVRIKGSHTLPTDLSSVRSVVRIQAKGVTAALATGRPVTVTLKLTYDGQLTM